MMRYPAGILLLLLLLALRYPPLKSAADFNLHALNFLETIVSADPHSNDIDQALDAFVHEHCRVLWLQGVVADRRDRVEQRDRAWDEAFACAPEHIVFARALAPESTVLPRQAMKRQPDTGAGWFWLAELRRQEAPTEAVQLLRKGLSLDPSNGLGWRYLGDLLRKTDPEEAIHAYLQACYWGDPGYHGCYGAGRTAEQLGQYERAITYYRLSNWSGARERIQVLQEEQNLTFKP